MDQTAFLTIRQVAPILGVSVPHAYALAADGVFPSVRSGGRIRVPRAAFDRWLEDQAQRALANVKHETVA